MSAMKTDPLVRLKAISGSRESHIGSHISEFYNVLRGGPTNLDKNRGRDKWNSAGYAAAASG